MQLLFLQGALHQEAIGFDVTALQDGKRFTSRHVRGAESGWRLIFDAQLSFAVALPAPAHAAPVEPLALQENPVDLPRLSDLPAAWAAEIARAPGYSLVDLQAVDFRLPSVATGLWLNLPEPRPRFWLKTTQKLPADAMLHAGVFAYLPDWWLNFASLGGHLPALGPDQDLYVASLNHAIWWHRPFRSDEWMHFDCVSPAADDGSGLTVARMHDRHRQLVASATRECRLRRSCRRRRCASSRRTARRQWLRRGSGSPTSRCCRPRRFRPACQRVGHAEAVDAMHAQLQVEHCGRVACRSHLAGAHRVVGGDDVGMHEGFEFGAVSGCSHQRVGQQWGCRLGAARLARRRPLARPRRRRRGFHGS